VFLHVNPYLELSTCRRARIKVFQFHGEDYQLAEVDRMETTVAMHLCHQLRIRYISGFDAKPQSALVNRPSNPQINRRNPRGLCPNGMHMNRQRRTCNHDENVQFLPLATKASTLLAAVMDEDSHIRVPLLVNVVPVENRQSKARVDMII
jgi:hypothetical protein